MHAHTWVVKPHEGLRARIVQRQMMIMARRVRLRLSFNLGPGLAASEDRSEARGAHESMRSQPSRSRKKAAEVVVYSQS